MTPEELLKSKKSIHYWNSKVDKTAKDIYSENEIIAAMKEYGDQRFIEGRDRALEWVKSKVKTEIIDYEGGRLAFSVLSEKTILSGKESPDLQP